MRISLLLFFSLFTVFTSALWALPAAEVQAGIIPCGLTKPDPAINAADDPTQGTSKCTLCHLVVGVNNIIILLRNVMSALAIVVVVAMAFVYITSAGDEGRMRFAKEGITAALIGFAIILLAWLAVNFVLTLPIFNTGPDRLIRVDWQKIQCNTDSLAK